MILLRKPSRYVFTLGFVFAAYAGFKGFNRIVKFMLGFMCLFFGVPILLVVSVVYVYGDEKPESAHSEKGDLKEDRLAGTEETNERRKEPEVDNMLDKPRERTDSELRKRAVNDLQ